jgi:limonene-1,2-epoxide hydrolase
MSDALAEVLEFFREWEPSKEAMIASMRRRFTPTTVWENVGLVTTTGIDEALGFLESFAAQANFATARVIVHHAAAVGNVVLTERDDDFFDAAGKKVLSIRLMGVFEMDGPRVLAWRDYFDTKAF